MQKTPLQLHHREGVVERSLDEMITSRYRAGVFVIKTHTLSTLTSRALFTVSGEQKMYWDTKFIVKTKV